MGKVMQANLGQRLEMGTAQTSLMVNRSESLQRYEMGERRKRVPWVTWLWRATVQKGGTRKLLWRVKITTRATSRKWSGPRESLRRGAPKGRAAVRKLRVAGPREAAYWKAGSFSATIRP